MTPGDTAARTSATFVMIHGAWHGGWCWQKVSSRLTSRGHRVLSPTLTGLGERSHLLNPQIDLKTHTQDIVNVVAWEDLEDVILVAHSYGGFVAAGVLSEIGPSISSLVLVDAFLPLDGEAMIDVLPPIPRQNLNAALAAGKTTIPPQSAARFRVNESDRERVDRKCTPQPIGTFLQCHGSQPNYDTLRRKVYIRATGFPSENFDEVRDRLSATAEWEIHQIACGHDIMLDRPDELAEILHLHAQPSMQGPADS